MSEAQTFIGLADLMARWGRSKAFVYGEVAARRLAPSDRGRWPLAEVKRYERAAYIEAQRRRRGDRSVDSAAA